MKKIVTTLFLVLVFSGCSNAEQNADEALKKRVSELERKMNCIQTAFAANNPENISKNDQSCLNADSDGPLRIL